MFQILHTFRSFVIDYRLRVIARLNSLTGERSNLFKKIAASSRNTLLLAMTQGEYSNVKVLTLKNIAFPLEHGAWGLLLESMVLGVVLVPTASGFLLAGFALIIFMLSQPLTIAIKDHRFKISMPRTKLARMIALFYSVISGALFIYAHKLGHGPFWVPLVLAGLLSGIYLFFSLNRAKKFLLAELASLTALGAVASAIAIAGGWSVMSAMVLWAILSVRTLTSVIFVRHQLEKKDGTLRSKNMVLLVQGLGGAVLLLLFHENLIPWPVLAGFTLLLIRVFSGLYFSKGKMTARQAGVREVIFGAAYVLCTIVGYKFD